MKSESERGHDGGVERAVDHLGIGVDEVGGEGQKVETKK